MTDQDDALVVWKRPLDPIKILAEQRGSVGIRITARVTKVPELIALSYPGIVAKGINHGGPARSCFLQAVNENHRRPRGIERLEPTKHCCVCICSWIQDTRQPKPFGTFTRNQKCRGRVEIGGKREDVFVQCDSFRV